MSNRITAAMALIAGFVGGGISHWIWDPASVHAQAAAPAPLEIRAQKFVLVDENGTPRGAFGINSTDDLPVLEVTDKKGHASRSRWYPAGFWGHAKPSVVPMK